MDEKRKILAKIYTPKWVAGKSDAQVFVIYQRLLAKGVIKV